MLGLRSKGNIITTVILLGMGCTLQAGPELLVRAKGRDGKESNLFEKIIITSSLTSIYDLPKSDAQNKVIEPFSVYYHLKGDDGSLEKNGFIRVGDGKGKPFGWIPKKDQKEKDSFLFWNTRFVLEPVDDPKRKFVLNDKDGKPIVETDKEAAIPEGKRKFALVTEVPDKEKGDDTQYPVAVYVGKVATKAGSLELERNEIANLKLEIVFVVEALTGMINGDKGVTTYDSVLSLFEETTALFENDPELKLAIQYGLVDFKDNVKGVPYAASIKQKLTNSRSSIMAAINGININDDGGDWAEDVFSGLRLAIDGAGWSENSSKHIILISSSAAQTLRKGVLGPNDFGSPPGQQVNILNKPRGDKDIDREGYSATGLSIDQILNLARPQGGSAVDKSRNSKFFHAILAGKKLENVDEKLEGLTNKLFFSTPSELESLINTIQDKLTADQIKEVIHVLRWNFVEKRFREIAKEQFSRITKNNNEFEGLFEVMEPNKMDVERTKTKLKKLIADSFNDLKKVRAGQMKAGEVGASNNQLTRSYYRIVNAALAEKFKDLDAIPGFASIRDESGREVAIKKVLVAKEELERLKSTFDELYTTFKGKTAKVDRQDVGKILEGLKQAIVSASTGQQVDEKTKLKDMIGDLPLRTAALDTTAADIAQMPSDTFTDWLDKLRQARTRVQDLLDSKTDWLALSEEATYDKYTFLRLNELP